MLVLSRERDKEVYLFLPGFQPVLRFVHQTVDIRGDKVRHGFSVEISVDGEWRLLDPRLQLLYQLHRAEVWEGEIEEENGLLTWQELGMHLYCLLGMEAEAIELFERERANVAWLIPPPKDEKEGGAESTSDEGTGEPEKRRERPRPNPADVVTPDDIAAMVQFLEQRVQQRKRASPQ